MNPTWRYARTAWVPSPRRKLAAIMATPFLFLASFASLTLTTMPLLFLFWLMQPATRANPGVSAYIPPPGARVEPIAHAVESREPPSEFSSATNFARDYTPPELIEDAQLHEIKVTPKHETRPANRKQSRVGYRRKYEQSARAYAQEWDNHWQPSYR
jgi:hypothetical protein